MARPPLLCRLLAGVALGLAASLQYPSLPADLSEMDFSKAPPNDEQRLLRHIMRSYDRSVRPVYQAADVVTVAVGMTLTHIFNVDEKKQVLSCNVWLEQEWHDQRIAWDPIDYGNITHAQDFSQGIAQTNVAIYPTGFILWAPPVKYHSTCKLDVSFFPFDDQICYMKFGSWIYDGSQMEVTNRSDKITIDKVSFTKNGEWEIVKSRVRRESTTHNRTTTYPGLTFTLHLRRRTLFYVYNVIIPCMMLSVLTMGQFWLPCESGEKITLGLTVLLAYSVFSFNIAENMPETSEVIPLVAIYLMCIMAISAVSVTLSVIVLNMRHGGERRRAVPVWLQYLAFRVLGPLVCWRGDIERRRHRRHSDISFQQAINSVVHQLARHHTARRRTPPPTAAAADALATATAVAWPIAAGESTAAAADATPLVPLSELPATAVGNGAPRPTGGSCSVPVARKVDFRVEDAPATERTRRQKALRNDIMRRAGKLMDRIDSDQQADELLHEWRKVSRIFDQFFFVLIFLLTVVATLLLLILAPRFSVHNHGVTD